MIHMEMMLRGVYKMLNARCQCSGVLVVVVV